MKITTLLLVLLCAAGCSVGSQRLHTDVASYTGDGELKDASIRSIVSSLGFRLTLPPFETKAADDRIYHLGKLPAMRENVIFFRLAQPSDLGSEFVERIAARSVTMEITNDAGVSVYRRESGPVEIRFDPRTSEADFQAALFTFDPEMHYTVTFRYVSQPGSPNIRLSLVLRCGGFF